VGSEYPFTDASIINAYSRTQAIEDGVLIDITETAREAGIRFPTAVTAALWSTVVATPEEARACGESDSGRLWDVVWMLRQAITAMAETKSDLAYFSVLATNDEGHRTEHHLSAKCGPGVDRTMVMKRKASIMKVIRTDEDFMSRRRERLPPGWWIVDLSSNSFFDGPYVSKEAALERYNRLPTAVPSQPDTIHTLVVECLGG